MRNKASIERALDFVAALIGAGHEFLAPIYVRLEQELTEAEQEQSVLDRARQRLRKAA